MRFNEIIKNEIAFKRLQDFISFKTLKGYPCPFCREKKVNFEKANEVHNTPWSGKGGVMATEIRVVCKSCRRVENYVRMTFDIKTDEILRVSNFRTTLQVGDGIYLDMEEGKKYKLYDQRHKFDIEVPPFFVNYLELDKISEKIEIMAVFL
jgi:hypothetical protein